MLKKYNDGGMSGDKTPQAEARNEFDASAKNQAQNKQIFLKKYGFESEILTYYLLDAKIYPADVKYSVKVVKYVIPQTELSIYNLKNNKLKKSTFAEIYSDPIYESDSVL